MSTINKDGMLIDKKVTLRRMKQLEHGNLTAVHAIVVHQTDTPTAQRTFKVYQPGGNGAHFLIGKPGTIYQTASMHKRCHHVGFLIKSKCLTINRKNCKSPKMAKILAMSWRNQINALNAHERAKQYPDRYPVNSDSIGIEIVGNHIYNETYETVVANQNDSLQWLLNELYGHFSISSADVFKHPEVSYKNPGEGKTVVWK